MTKTAFSGTQHGMTDAQKVTLRWLLDGGAGEFHHGDCDGSDDEAHDIATELGYKIFIHPPKNPSKRAFRKVPPEQMFPEKDYLPRNKDIVRAGASLIATPFEFVEILRSGTWSTVRFARKLGKPVFLILPDGTVER
jgi:hypothetical protein